MWRRLAIKFPTGSKPKTHSSMRITACSRLCRPIWRRRLSKRSPRSTALRRICSSRSCRSPLWAPWHLAPPLHRSSRSLSVKKSPNAPKDTPSNRQKSPSSYSAFWASSRLPFQKHWRVSSRRCPKSSPSRPPSSSSSHRGSSSSLAPSSSHNRYLAPVARSSSWSSKAHSTSLASFRSPTSSAYSSAAASSACGLASSSMPLRCASSCLPN